MGSGRYESDQPESWIARRHRKAVAAWGGRFRALKPPPGRGVALFCDCEGRHAGQVAASHADAGLSTLLEILRSRGQRITFNVVADLCNSHSHRLRNIIAAGHEVACHGLAHERPRELSRPQLKEMLAGAKRAFQAVGARPIGFRSPESAWSVPLLRELPRHGFAWNAERDPATRPYQISAAIVRVPVWSDDWDLVDGTIDPQSTAGPGALIEKWRAIVARMTEGHAISIGLHEWVFGLCPGFADALGNFLDDLRRRDGVRVQTLGEMAGVAISPAGGTIPPCQSSS